MAIEGVKASSCPCDGAHPGSRETSYEETAKQVEGMGILESRRRTIRFGAMPERCSKRSGPRPAEPESGPTAAGSTATTAGSRATSTAHAGYAESIQISLSGR